MSLVSIIIPVYNREKTILKAINSVIYQTYSNWELIIVDDCSTDKTAIIISKIDDSRIFFHQLKVNSGAGAARNFGIKKSKGNFISFLDSDDTFEPDFLKISYEALSNSAKDTGFIWTGSNIFHGGNIYKQIWQPKRMKTPHLTFLTELKIGTGAGVTIKREVFEKCGYFDERLPAAEDTEFFFRISQTFDYVFAPLYLINIYRDDQDRMSKNFQNIATAYNIFLPSYFSVINRDKYLQAKFYYKMMWLNYHLLNKKQARGYFKMIPINNLKTFFRTVGTKMIYEILPLKWAKFLHLKFYRK